MLTRKQVKDWVRPRNVTAKTIGNIISPLRIALDDAVEDELIEVNPLSDWWIRRKRSKNKPVDDVDPFDADKRQTLLNALEGQNCNLVAFWFWAG